MMSSLYDGEKWREESQIPLEEEKAEECMIPKQEFQFKITIIIYQFGYTFVHKAYMEGVEPM